MAAVERPLPLRAFLGCGEASVATHCHQRREVTAAKPRLWLHEYHTDGTSSVLSDQPMRWQVTAPELRRGRLAASDLVMVEPSEGCSAGAEWAAGKPLAECEPLIDRHHRFGEPVNLCLAVVVVN